MLACSLEQEGYMRPTAVSLALAFAIIAGAPQIAAAQKVGVASAIKNDVQRVSPAPSQQMSAGSELVANQRIRTGDASSAQLLFLDETSVSMGARSDLVLDRFVYNPNRGSGNVVLSTARGALRFVTGAQNPTNYTIKTPVATIGVRGTIAEILTYTSGGVTFSRITNVEGLLAVTARSGQVVTVTPGMSVLISSAGAVQGPFKADLAGINAAGSVPMFGTTIPTYSRTFDVPDSRLDMTDQIKALTPPPPPPPPPPTNSGGGNFR
jgi:FecR protein